MIYYQEPKHTIYCGHALDILKEMPDESVDCVVTSPPYWGLRTYKTEPIIWGEKHCEHNFGEDIKVSGHHSGETNPGLESNFKDADSGFDTRIRGNFCLKCNAWRGELGLEPTIELYIQHLILIFNEAKRVLKKTGTCWVNLDDSYAGSGCGTNDYRTEASRSINKSNVMFSKKPPQQRVDMPAKSLCLIPQRFALAMVETSWLLRNDICWYKSNPMPESVKDRFTGSWEHLFFFVKSKKYWFEQQFEQYSPITLEDGRIIRVQAGVKLQHIRQKDFATNKCQDACDVRDRTLLSIDTSQGRNKRDVWEINTQPYPEAHFATFPEKLCEIPILAGCPSMICKKCGKAREKVYETELIKNRPSAGNDPRSRNEDRLAEARGHGGWQGNNLLTQRTEIGYTDCGCEPKEYEPGLVLDPFTGSGTVQAVAKRLGRKSIGIELNPNYCKLAAKRLQGVPMAMELVWQKLLQQ